MNLEIMMLSEIRQIEKVEKHDLTYMCDIKLKATNEQDRDLRTWTTVWW